MKRNNKGFTLAELLIVVAIIAVLVAIAIPVFTSQLEKSKEATDMANVRSAYAEVLAEYLSDSQTHTATVALKSNTDNVKGTYEAIAGVAATDIIGNKATSVDVVVDANGNVTINGKEATTTSLTN